jgi:hypothetical protein
MDHKTAIELFNFGLVAARKKIGAERCECLFDAHTSKASKELKVVLLHLWRPNVKTTGGFIYISLGDFQKDKPRHNNITNCKIVV